MGRGTQQRGRLNDVDRADLTLRRAAEGTKFERLTTEVGEILGRPLSLPSTDRHDLRWVDRPPCRIGIHVVGDYP